MLTHQDQHFWNQRYTEGSTGWDIGHSSGPMNYWMNQIADKNARILIPGCGNAYEAKYLLENGFTDITLLDIAPDLVKKLKAEFSNSTNLNILCEDFFNHDGKYDVILEQTFFCALPPSARPLYVEKMYELLAPQGILCGVLFGVEFEKEGPPFGGQAHEYEVLFKRLFKIDVLQPCEYSIPPRAGSELIFKLST